MRDILSDESNLAAATLLTPLISGRGAAPGPSVFNTLEHRSLFAPESESDSFAALLSKNFDGSIEDLESIATPHYQGLTTTNARLLGSSDTPRQELATSPALASLLPIGRGLPASGDLLPSDQITDPNELYVQSIVEGSQQFSEQPAVNAIAETNIEGESDIDPSSQQPLHSRRNLTAEYSPESLVGSSAIDPQLASGVSATDSAVISRPEPQIPLRRDPTGLTHTALNHSGVAGTTEGSGVEGEAAQNEGTFEDQARQNAGQTDLLPALRSTQRAIAEFTANDNRPTPSSSPNSGSILSSAEAGATVSLPQLQSSSLNSAATSPSLLLAADRQVAGQQVAQHVASFVRQGHEFAELNLSPPHLGKISVRITMQNDQTNVVLTAPSPEIREIIESSLPRLGELLKETGLNLADANVFSQTPQGQNDEYSEDGAGENQPTEGLEDNSSAAPTQLGVSRLVNLLDAYA